MVAIEILEAAEDGDIRALEKFGKSLVTESVSDTFGSNCLHYAARQGGVNVIRFLIKQMGFSGTKRSNIGKEVLFERYNISETTVTQAYRLQLRNEI